jgi:Cupin
VKLAAPYKEDQAGGRHGHLQIVQSRCLARQKEHILTDMTFQPSGLSDPLGEVLHMMRMTGTLYCSATMSAPWGVTMPTLIESLMFNIVTAGECWIRIGGDMVHLPLGSMVLLPHGTAYDIVSSPEETAVPLFDIPVQRIGDRYEIMVHGGGGAITKVTTGVVKIDHAAAKRLVSVLPRVVRVADWQKEVQTWVTSTLGLIEREASSMRPGGETVLTRLADILVIQAIRAWLDSAPETGVG